jgi:hypothetical protein
MPSPPNNLFWRLHKWAWRQDENFLTESLALVLEQLLALAPAVGTRLVARLTDNFIQLAPDDASAIEIQPQVEAGEGRPDLEISIPHRLVWIEVKAEAELRAGQLEGYRVLLGERGVEQTRLILLTQYPEVFAEEDARPDHVVRWFEVADWLESEIAAAEEASAIAGFLARQFLDFLGARRMKLAQVGKYMPEGLRAWGSLLHMLFEAAAACKVSATLKGAVGLEYSGVKIDGPKYWVGVDYAEPEKLCFATRTRIDPAAASKLSDGEISEDKWVPGGYCWWRSVDLNSELVHFFARSKVSQMEWLEGFLRECLEMARSIETPDQPPIPEEPEGN